MHDSTASHRDWFRLRLSQVPAPPNYHGMDLSELPPMSEAVLDGNQLNSLIQDIRLLASDITLMKQDPLAARSQDKQDGTSDGKSFSQAEVANLLETAGTWLQSGQIQRLQIRYVWENSRWIDTLERKPEGFRLVRICHQSETI